MQNKSYTKLFLGLLLLVVIIITILYFTRVRNNPDKKSSFISKLFGVTPKSEGPKRMITYWEGWGPTVYGTPKNYTHMVFSFIVPYHYWGGY